MRNRHWPTVRRHANLPRPVGTPVSDAQFAAGTVHAIVPLAVLEALQALDAPASDDPEEYRTEVTQRRLGTSRSVAQQIDRYRRLAARDGRVSAQEVQSLLRLCHRRPDAALVFTDAGRRAALHALHHAASAARLLRLLPPRLRTRAGRALAVRLAREVFDLAAERDGQRVVARALRPHAAEATSDSTACALYGSALAGLLYGATDFDGAVLHRSCRARGAPACVWETTPPPDRTA